jgi:hypothetical protein
MGNLEIYSKIRGVKLNTEEKIYFEMDGLIEQAIVNAQTRGLIIVGASSLGKTFRVKKKCDSLGLTEGKDYLIHSGHTTPMRLYVKLHNNSDKIHIFDDVDILSDKTSLNLLKAMLDKNTHGIVEYDTSRKMPPGVKDKFIFTGKVIALLNELPSNGNEHLKAFENRVLTYYLNMNRNDILKCLHERATNEDIVGITVEDRLAIVKWLEENTNEATLNLNYRLYEKAVYMFIHNKETWKTLCMTQIKRADEYTTLVIEGCAEQEFIKKTGLSRRSYYNYKAKLRGINKNELG